MKKNLLLAAAAIFTLASCSHNRKPELTPEESYILEPIQAENYTPAGNSYPQDDGIVAVVFGYGFNQQEYFAKECEKLQKKFGLSSEGGIVLPLRFPEDFNRRTMNIYNNLSDYNLRGLVVLGAPENTHYAFARFLDEYQDQPPFSIISLFPQDEILGQEATASIVMEFDTSHQDVDKAETELELTEGISNLLENTIRKLYATDQFILPSTTDLLSYARELAPHSEVKHYTDSETGLWSVNHFTVKENANE